jgi:hypothetical protein
VNLRGIANGVASTVNPNIIVSVRRSEGYTIGAGARQIPAYAAAVEGPAQMQALDGSDLKQLEGLNVQGVIKGLFLTGNLAGVIRPESKGGDLIDIGEQTWLVTKVLEGWPTWTKVAIVLQEST